MNTDSLADWCRTEEEIFEALHGVLDLVVCGREGFQPVSGESSPERRESSSRRITSTTKEPQPDLKTV